MNNKDKLGLSWSKISSYWNWNFVLLDLRLGALSYLTKILLATLTGTNKHK